MKRNQIVWSHEMLMQNSEEEDKGREEMGFQKTPWKWSEKGRLWYEKGIPKSKNEGEEQEEERLIHHQHTVWSHTLSLSLSLSLF